MTRRRLRFGCASAALALFGCGQPDSKPAASKPGGTGGGVTIELPEPKAAPAPPSLPGPQKDKAESAAPKIEEAPPAVAEVTPDVPEPEAPKAKASAPEAALKSDIEPTRGESSPLPLPRPVVARTIEQIGYPCGAVASSTRIDAPAGEMAYRITCTSGDSYRASDRSGRFRFRKWSQSGE